VGRPREEHRGVRRSWLGPKMNDGAPTHELAPAMHWGDMIHREDVFGEPCLCFQTRPKHLAELFLDARRFTDRTYLADAEWVIAFWATIAAQAVVVLGNAWWSAEEVQHAVAESAPSLVIADQRCRGKLGIEVLSLLFGEFVAEQTSEPTSRVVAPVPDENATAVVLFTAGTTGRPKGAILTHRGILSTLQSLLLISNRLPSAQRPRPGPSTALVSLPLFHIGGLQQIITPMVTGGTVAFTSGRFDPAQVVELIERHSINIWSGVPTMVSRVVDFLEQSGGKPMPQVRTIGMGGSLVSDALRAKVRLWFPNSTRRIAVTYGLSEAGGVVATATGDSVTDRPGSVGRALPTVDIRIDAIPDVGDGDGDGDGEILVRAPSVMLGYLTAALSILAPLGVVAGFERATLATSTTTATSSSPIGSRTSSSAAARTSPPHMSRTSSTNTTRSRRLPSLGCPTRNSARR
jgi:long-chain acyl-CoA synthetase